MRNISENVRKIGREYKVLWRDGDKVVETWTESRTVDVGKLQGEIAMLEEQIANTPDVIEVPTDKETLRVFLKQKQDELRQYG